MSRRSFLKSAKSMLVLATITAVLMTTALPLGNIKVNAAAVGTVQEGKSYRNVMYYGDWSIWDGQSNFYPQDIPADKLTHLNFAFMDFDSNGNLQFTDETAAIGHPLGHSDVTYNDINGGVLNAFQVLKRQNPNLKIGVSLGGWSKSGDFSAVSKNATARKNFVKNVLAFIKYANMDFVDIDWEYPTSVREPDLCDNSRDEGTKQSTPEDKKYFVDLLQEFRTALDKQGQELKRTYELSAALPAPVQKVKDGIDVQNVFKLLDFANIMTYDMRGAWEPISGHHTGLYNNPNDPDIGKGLSVDDSVKYYLSQGAPSEKIVIGAAYYTRGWEKVKDKGVDPKNPGLFGEAEVNYRDADQSLTSGAMPEAPLRNGDGGRRTGTWSYNNIYEKVTGSKTEKTLIQAYPGLKEYWDDYAKAPYLYNPTTGAFFTYDNARSIEEKCKYIKANNLGGMIGWMASQDKQSDRGSTKRDELTNATYKSLYGEDKLPKYQVHDARPNVSVSNLKISQGDYGNGGLLTLKITNNEKVTESGSVVSLTEKSAKTLKNVKIYIKTKGIKLTMGNYPTPTPKEENGYYVVDYGGGFESKLWSPGASRDISIKTDKYIDKVDDAIVSVYITQRTFLNTPEFGKKTIYGNTADTEIIDSNGNYLPEISGLEDRRITKGESFNPMDGVTAYDVEDGDLTSKIKVQGTVNVNVLGEYKLTYSVTDSKGAVRTWTITITVGKKLVLAADTYKAGVNYAKGDIVVYKGHRYELVYYSSLGYAPDTTLPGIWQDLGEAWVEVD